VFCSGVSPKIRSGTFAGVETRRRPNILRKAFLFERTRPPAATRSAAQIDPRESDFVLLSELAKLVGIPFS